MKKFELTSNKINYAGRTLFQIKACIDFVTAFGDVVKAGDLGGFIEKESNLSQNGKSWVFDNAKICDDAKIFGDAKIWGNAEVGDHAKVYGDAEIFNNAEVWGNAEVCDNAKIFGNARVFGHAKVCNYAEVCNNAEVWGNAKVCNMAEVFGNVNIYDNAKIFSDVKIGGDAKICGDAEVSSFKHIFCVSPIDEDGYPICIFRTKNHKIKIHFEYRFYEVDDFKKLISTWNDREREIAIGAIEIAHKCIDLS